MWSPWTEPTYADSTLGDSIDGDDLAVRKAAVDALGPLNGSVVVTDPTNGRVLTIVNQKLALKSGFQPCSTIKVVAALAGLTEGLIERKTPLQLTRRTSMDLTTALAKSNNPYFANVGEKLGFDRVNYYARKYGLGEKAGLNIDGEKPGTLPLDTPSEGLGMMTSFGSGITLTPLQLAALMTVVSNNGTLYYLQYPRTQVEVEHFVPRVKRQLELSSYVPEIKPGMMGAVEFGTARRASVDQTETILGKTGTCTDSRSPTHLGWFGSFNEIGKNKLVVVVLLTGGRGVSGPAASGVAGGVYRNLAKEGYFEKERPVISPVALISTQSSN
jgi:cell division protein FtsI/penicillin-binding protein 2